MARKKPRTLIPVDACVLRWIETPGSSLIARFAYEEERAVLVVEFRSGDEYQYFDVPRTVHDELVAASSKGQFFSAAIRDRYPCRRTG